MGPFSFSACARPDQDLGTADWALRKGGRRGLVSVTDIHAHRGDNMGAATTIFCLVVRWRSLRADHVG